MRLSCRLFACRASVRPQADFVVRAHGAGVPRRMRSGSSGGRSRVGSWPVSSELACALAAASMTKQLKRVAEGTILVRGEGCHLVAMVKRRRGGLH